jgi:Xaa-Pro aminopeptidase
VVPLDSAPRLDRSFFAERRKCLFDAMGPHSVAVFEGAAAGHGRLQQDSDFYYLTGFSEPAAVCVLLTTDSERSFILFVQPHDAKAERWDGKRAGIEGATEEFGADAAYAVQDLEKKLPSLLDRASTLYLTPNINTRSGRHILEAFQNSAKSFARVGHGASELRDPAAVLTRLRMRKTPEEILLMRHAAAITREAYAAAIPEIRPGRWEFEIESLLDHAFRRQGGDGPAYTTIVGSGDNATILHYVANSRRIEPGDLVLVDAAAAYGHYVSDVTRTFPADGRFRPAQRSVYEAVLRTQKETIGNVRPGVSVKELHKAGALSLIEEMKRLRWLPDEPAEALFKEHRHHAFFMHGIGHYLGLDTHDAGFTEMEGSPYPLEEGMVITVEPGLYVPRGTEGVAEEFQGIGVRIEDDVLVTADGAEVLTVGIPKEIEEVEEALSR